jgi:hypothetical protein
MSTRHPYNTNLSLHSDSHWNGLPVMASPKRPLIDQYLARIHETLSRSLEEYPRSFAIRFDLRFPMYSHDDDSSVISRFVASLDAKIQADIERRLREGKAVRPCRLRYVWVKEINTAYHCHYHVVIFLNRDTYATLGTLYPDDTECFVDVPRDPQLAVRRGMAERIVEAYASALRIDVNHARGLAHFPDDCCYDVDVNSARYVQQFMALFLRASYLAKATTKEYGDGTNWFGSSRV